MGKGRDLLWAPYFYGASLSSVLEETAKGVENV
jgi:hypothetical protein